MKPAAALLEGRSVRLDPLAEGHREELRAACAADQEIWAIYPWSMVGEHFDTWWRGAVGPESDWVLFAILQDDVCVGVTGFVPERAPGIVVIGGTYIRPEARGGPANPGSKRLLLEHAFTSGARRAVFHVDVVNARSRAAMAKLGAVQEGITRQASITWTGRVRDLVVFSILADEWPMIREALDARLAGFVASAPGD